MAIISEVQEEEQCMTPQEKDIIMQEEKPQEKEVVMEKKENTASSSDEKPASSSDEKPEEDKPKRVVPNTGNGLDMEKYSWTQTLEEVNISIPVPQGTKSRSVSCEIKKNHIKVGLKGQPPVIDGDFFQSVKLDDSFWNIEDSNMISILLTKQNKRDWWKYLVQGEPEIDTQKCEPETSKLSDLDGETRATVEKMMFDQRQQQLGLPTSKETEDQEMMKKFKSQFPDMDFGTGKNNMDFSGMKNMDFSGMKNMDFSGMKETDTAGLLRGLGRK